LYKKTAIEESIYRLSDLLDEIQIVIRSTFDRTYWVIGEIVSISEAKNGHVYFEIAEKDNDFLRAKVRANLWSNSKSRIYSEFKHITNQTLKKGMNVLFNISIDFHAVYGLSFTILDIDPNFSLGEIERQKQNTLHRLEQEGLLDFNKQYILPHVIQHIAIISSETAAGFQDFMKQIKENSYNYTFSTTLFQAVMQGEKAAKSIVSALEKIEESRTHFDVIVLIRGGGSSLDLSCFDDYFLVSRLAQSLFPLITGIGHERDSSIADKVAHTQLKTPTAVAEFILLHNRKFENKLNEYSVYTKEVSLNTLEKHYEKLDKIGRNLNYFSQHKIHKHAKRILKLQHHFKQSAKMIFSKSILKINRFQFKLENNSKMKMQQNKMLLNNMIKGLGKGEASLISHNLKKLDSLKKKLVVSNLKMLKSNVNRLENFEHLVSIANPKHILKRGFSISRYDGKIVRNVDELIENTLIHTELCNGEFESKIVKTHKYEQET